MSGYGWWLAAMEPAPWERDDGHQPGVHGPGTAAAMEPAPGERDDPLLSDLLGRAVWAAMEPAPWERDDLPVCSLRNFASAPQWSPLLGSGMTASTGKPSSTLSRPNGARSLGAG